MLRQDCIKRHTPLNICFMRFFRYAAIYALRHVFATLRRRCLIRQLLPLIGCHYFDIFDASALFAHADYMLPALRCRLFALLLPLFFVYITGATSR